MGDKFAFISRHSLTDHQREVFSAYFRGTGPAPELVEVGDLDAFSPELSNQLNGLQEQGFRGVVCVHPVVALEAFQLGLDVGVFENVNRAEPGEPPRFECGGIRVFYPEFY